MLFTTSSERFDNDVLLCDQLVLVEFFATWCGPCRASLPILDEFANENPNIKVVTVDVDASPDLASSYDVKHLPTLLVFKGGLVFSRVIGAITLYEIEDLLQSAQDTAI
jgi:thioredoxin 1